MAIHRGIQSVLFYYLSCTPCIEARNTRERKKAAELAALEALEKRQSGPADGSCRITIQPHHTNPAWDIEIALGPSRQATELARHRAKNDGRPSSKNSITTKSGWKCSIPDSELDDRIAWAKTFQRDDDPLRPYYRHPQMTYADATAGARPEESRITPGGTYKDIYTYPPMDELFPDSPQGTPTNAAPSSPAEEVLHTPQNQTQSKGVLRRSSLRASPIESLQTPAEPSKVLRFRRPKDRETETSDYFFPGSSESSAVNTLRVPKKNQASSSKEDPKANYHFSPPQELPRADPAANSLHVPAKKRKPSSIEIPKAVFTFPLPLKLPQANPALNDLHPPTVTKIDHPAEVAWMREPPPPNTTTTPKRSDSAHGKAHIYRSPNSKSHDNARAPTLRVVDRPKRSPARDLPHLRRRDSGTSSDW